MRRLNWEVKQSEFTQLGEWQSCGSETIICHFSMDGKSLGVPGCPAGCPVCPPFSGCSFACSWTPRLACTALPCQGRRAAPWNKVMGKHRGLWTKETRSTQGETWKLRDENRYRTQRHRAGCVSSSGCPLSLPPGCLAGPGPSTGCGSGYCLRVCCVCGPQGLLSHLHEDAPPWTLYQMVLDHSNWTSLFAERPAEGWSCCKKPCLQACSLQSLWPNTLPWYFQISICVGRE